MTNGARERERECRADAALVTPRTGRSVGLAALLLAASLDGFAPPPAQAAVAVPLPEGAAAATQATATVPRQASRTPDDEQQPAQQQEEKEQEGKARGFDLVINERVMVVGSASRVEEIPGSAHYLAGAELERQAQAFTDIHRLLLQVPGINVVEEEGYGLRPNIGLRGSGSERSAKITLMEDGVLIAPAPYASPSAYYFPVAGRMEAIEVRKGSSQIKYGPRTTGGALNLISTSIPYDLDLRAELAGGSDRTGRAHVSAGGSTARFGWLLETYQVSSDGFKTLDAPVEANTGFNVQDYLAKLRLNSDRSAPVYQELVVKAGYNEQVSDETYLGLTQADFEADPLRRYAASQQDVFRSDHRQLQARYFVAPSEHWDLTAIAYRNDFARNWYKLQSIDGVGIANLFDDPERFAPELAIARGADSAADGLRVRANNREYYSQGVQAIVGRRLEIGRVHNDLELGVRWHRDQEDRLQHEDGFAMDDGRMVLTGRGAPGSQANRLSDAEAWAVFLQDRISAGRWTLTPGLRFETVDLVRSDYSTADPSRRAGPTRVRRNGVDVFIPGLGVSFALRPELSLFGGVHKGFAPPGPGSTEETEAEESVNYELGLRLREQAARFQVVGFFNDYSNLLGADTLSSGGQGTGDLFNGGAVHVWGLEASAEYDVARLAALPLRLPARVAYTYTGSRFLNGFDSEFEPWGTVEVGDELPYLARHQVSAGIGVVDDRWSLDLQAGYVGRMRTEAGQAEVPAGRGTDAHLLVDLGGELDLGGRLELFGGVQNLTDRRYVVARRPAGARPGAPRTFTIGLRLDF